MFALMPLFFVLTMLILEEPTEYTLEESKVNKKKHFDNYKVEKTIDSYAKLSNKKSLLTNEIYYNGLYSQTKNTNLKSTITGSVYFKPNNKITFKLDTRTSDHEIVYSMSVDATYTIKGQTLLLSDFNGDRRIINENGIAIIEQLSENSIRVYANDTDQYYTMTKIYK